MFDIQNFKIYPSQIGSLMGNSRGGTKPPTETEIKKLFGILGRDYGELTEPQKFTAREILTKAILYDPRKPSNTILNEIVLIYAYQMYGKGSLAKGNESPLQLEKGNLAEQEAIKFVSRIDGVEYQKNSDIFENKWFKGVPDILVRNGDGKIEKIIEVKTSYDLPSFILSKLKPEKTSNIYEVMGYMDLTKCKQAEIVHVLIDMPGKIASFEEKRLRERYESFQLDEEVIENRILSRLSDMEYSNIPENLKYFRRPVVINKYSMKTVKSRALIAKKWMADVHNSFTINNVDLSENNSENQEDSI